MKTTNKTNFVIGVIVATTFLATIMNGCKKNTPTPSPANLSPTVSITSPANASSFNAPATVNIAATATDADGSITKVEFYNGATLLGTATAAPYSFSMTNVAAGSYTLTAKAYDNSSASTTSTAVSITVNAAQGPTVSITSPADGSTFTAPATVNITTNTTDASGTITKVEFYNGSTLLGTTTSSPYSFSWTNATAGTYTLTAKAYDNSVSATSSAVTITVNSNPPPTVSIISPASGSSYNEPGTVYINTNATPASGGTITKVEFYNGSTLLGTTTSSPYSYNWTNVPAGTYSITAKAYDNSVSTTSSAITVTVNSIATYDGTLCGGDTICKLSYRIMPDFIPSGYYGGCDYTTTLTMDSLGETPAYTNEGIRIVYHYGSGGYWGASFLNNNNWTATYNLNSAATKITFKLRIDYSANVTFNAFANSTYGKVEFYKATTVPNPVWQDVTIPLSSIPSNFASPLNIIVDFPSPPAAGTVVVVDIKDLQFE